MQLIVAPIALHDIGPQVANLIEALLALLNWDVIIAEDQEESTQRGEKSWMGTLCLYQV